MTRNNAQNDFGQFPHLHCRVVLPPLISAMRYWKKLSPRQQDMRITAALNDNIDYRQTISMGIPASRLDPVVFYDQASFLTYAPLLRTYVANPNHIGCHTLNESEAFFKGTQDVERELVELLCCDVFEAAPASCDGYVAAGGTEANIQAVWIYRNYFIQEHGAAHNEIAILCSEDTHYSVHKAANLLNIRICTVPVHPSTRAFGEDGLYTAVQQAHHSGIKYFIVIANMATTMFGSVDDVSLYVDTLTAMRAHFKLHIDAAFGGFIYPFSNTGSSISFSNPAISSIALDAHKMLQAPYGTGIFLCRKGLMSYVFTSEASYVSGADITLSGSRSGTNAVAVWMIMQTYGPYGWREKINKLLHRTQWCCDELDKLGVSYFRHPGMNIITIKAVCVPNELVERYGLVPDDHHNPAWYKIVVMEHVEMEHLTAFIADMKLYSIPPSSCSVK
jgi:tyrosine decarboxylase/aspartate 1-decarboxylase